MTIEYAVTPKDIGAMCRYTPKHSPRMQLFVYGFPFLIGAMTLLIRAGNAKLRAVDWVIAAACARSKPCAGRRFSVKKTCRRQLREPPHFIARPAKSPITPSCRKCAIIPGSRLRLQCAMIPNKQPKTEMISMYFRPW